MDIYRPVRWMLGYEGIPALARPTFRYDFLSSILAALGSGPLLLEMTQLIVKKQMGGGAWLLGVLWAQVAVGNFLGTFYADFLQRRRRVQIASACRLVIALVMLVLAALPSGRGSAIPYVLLLGIPALLGSLIFNAQSGVWHANYPHASRGRIYSRLMLVRLLCAAASVKLCGMALDNLSWSLPLLYISGACLMAASAMVYRMIRVRGEQTLLRQTQKRRFDLLGGFSVLWTDRAFGKYMLWQMVSGASLMMTGVVLVNDLVEVFHVGFNRGAEVLFLIPAAVQFATVPAAGHLFDRISIMRYRTINQVFWAANRFVLLGAFLTGSVPLLCIGYAVQGLASSTAGVVWDIGHTRFAPPEKSQLYMGIHMTLTGIRGLVMPFLGIWLHQYLGIWLIAIAGGMQVLAGLEFFLSEDPHPSPTAHAGTGAQSAR